MLIQMLPKYVLIGPISTNPALVQIIALHQTSDNPLFESTMGYLIKEMSVLSLLLL